jgi:hypothetical protein
VRIERLRERASAAEGEGHARVNAARRIGAMIPMGQPILVGHHSERRHRRDLARIDASYRGGFAALEKAKTLASRAASAERNNMISSDDPSAADRIRDKIAKLEKVVAQMKDANKRIRSGRGDRAKSIAALVAGGLTEKQAEGLLTPDFAGRIGFAAYQLTNDGAEIRRLKKRLAALAAVEVRGEIADEEIGEVTLRDEDNRTQLVFPGKPPETIRDMLKSSGFRWAPSTGAWQRMSSEQARRAAREIARAFAAQ